MQVDSLVEELPTGAQTNIGVVYPVAVHSREFCPTPQSCSHAARATKNRKPRALVPCRKCGAPRSEPILGYLSGVGNHVALCARCRDARLPNGPASWLNRARRNALLGVPS